MKQQTKIIVLQSSKMENNLLMISIECLLYLSMVKRESLSMGVLTWDRHMRAITGR
jgi:hypothetical protein